MAFPGVVNQIEDQGRNLKGKKRFSLYKRQSKIGQHLFYLGESSDVLHKKKVFLFLSVHWQLKNRFFFNIARVLKDVVKEKSLKTASASVKVSQRSRSRTVFMLEIALYPHPPAIWESKPTATSNLYLFVGNGD